MSEAAWNLAMATGSLLGANAHVLRLQRLFNFYAEASVLPLVRAVQALLPPILPADQLTFVTALLLAYPLALIFARLPRRALWMKHLFNVVFGVFFAQLTLGSMWAHSAVTVFVSWALIRWAPPSVVHICTAIFVITYICIAHMHRMVVDYGGWTMDFTGIQMVLTIKLSALAFNVHDGLVPENRRRIERIAAGEEPPPKGHRIAVYASRKRRMLTRYPTLLQYLGYCYCFSGLVCGPAFDFADYIDGCTANHFHDGVATGTTASKAKGGNDAEGKGATTGWRRETKGKQSLSATSVRAGAARHAATQAMVAVLCCVMHLIIDQRFSKELLYLEDGDDTAQVAVLGGGATVWHIIATNLLVMAGIRFKYYFAWKLSEGSCVLAGFGFERIENGIARFGGSASSMDVVGFETAQSIRDQSRCWNKGTQTWLERYIYLRLPRKFALIGTYTISAWWHGFYAGYYIFFCSVPLATEVGRLLRKRVRPYFLDDGDGSSTAKRVYDVASLVGAHLAANYLNMPFQALSLERGIRSLRRVYFSGHILLALMWVVLLLLPEPRPKVTEKKKHR